MTEPHQIHTATADDAHALRTYLEAFTAEGCPFVRGRAHIPTVEEQAAYIRRLVDSPPSTLIIARGDDKIVGMLDFHARAHPQENHVGAFGMSVLQGFRRRGIGRALCKALFEQLAAFPGISRVELEVFATNQAAIRLYESCGFHHEGRRQKALRANDAFIDLLLMAHVSDDKRQPTNHSRTTSFCQ